MYKKIEKETLNRTIYAYLSSRQIFKFDIIKKRKNN